MVALQFEQFFSSLPTLLLSKDCNDLFIMLTLQSLYLYN